MKILSFLFLEMVLLWVGHANILFLLIEGHFKIHAQLLLNRIIFQDMPCDIIIGIITVSLMVVEKYEGIYYNISFL